MRITQQQITTEAVACFLNQKFSAKTTIIKCSQLPNKCYSVSYMVLGVLQKRSTIVSGSEVEKIISTQGKKLFTTAKLRKLLVNSRNVEVISSTPHAAISTTNRIFNEQRCTCPFFWNDYEQGDMPIRLCKHTLWYAREIKGMNSISEIINSKQRMVAA